MATPPNETPDSHTTAIETHSPDVSDEETPSTILNDADEDDIHREEALTEDTPKSIPSKKQPKLRIAKVQKGLITKSPKPRQWTFVDPSSSKSKSTAPKKRQKKEVPSYSIEIDLTDATIPQETTEEPAPPNPSTCAKQTSPSSAKSKTSPKPITIIPFIPKTSSVNNTTKPLRSSERLLRRQPIQHHPHQTEIPPSHHHHGGGGGGGDTNTPQDGSNLRLSPSKCAVVKIGTPLSLKERKLLSEANDGSCYLCNKTVPRGTICSACNQARYRASKHFSKTILDGLKNRDELDTLMKLKNTHQINVQDASRHGGCVLWIQEDPQKTQRKTPPHPLPTSDGALHHSEEDNHDMAIIHEENYTHDRAVDFGPVMDTGVAQDKRITPLAEDLVPTHSTPVPNSTTASSPLSSSSSSNRCNTTTPSMAETPPPQQPTQNLLEQELLKTHLNKFTEMICEHIQTIGDLFPMIQHSEEHMRKITNVYRMKMPYSLQTIPSFRPAKIKEVLSGHKNELLVNRFRTSIQKPPVRIQRKAFSPTNSLVVVDSLTSPTSTPTPHPSIPRPPRSEIHKEDRIPHRRIPPRGMSKDDLSALNASFNDHSEGYNPSLHANNSGFSAPPILHGGSMNDPFHHSPTLSTEYHPQQQQQSPLVQSASDDPFVVESPKCVTLVGQNKNSRDHTSDSSPIDHLTATKPPVPKRLPSRPDSARRLFPTKNVSPLLSSSPLVPSRSPFAESPLPPKSSPSQKSLQDQQRNVIFHHHHHPQQQQQQQQQQQSKKTHRQNPSRKPQQHSIQSNHSMDHTQEDPIDCLSPSAILADARALGKNTVATEYTMTPTYGQPIPSALGDHDDDSPYSGDLPHLDSHHESKFEEEEDEDDDYNYTLNTHNSSSVVVEQQKKNESSSSSSLKKRSRSTIKTDRKQSSRSDRSLFVSPPPAKKPKQHHQTSSTTKKSGRGKLRRGKSSLISSSSDKKPFRDVSEEPPSADWFLQASSSITANMPTISPSIGADCGHFYDHPRSSMAMYDGPPAYDIGIPHPSPLGSGITPMYLSDHEYVPSDMEDDFFESQLNMMQPPPVVESPSSSKKEETKKETPIPFFDSSAPPQQSPQFQYQPPPSVSRKKSVSTSRSSKRTKTLSSSISRPKGDRVLRRTSNKKHHHHKSTSTKKPRQPITSNDAIPEVDDSEFLPLDDWHTRNSNMDTITPCI